MTASPGRLLPMFGSRGSRSLGQLPWPVDRDVSDLRNRHHFIRNDQGIQLHPLMALVLVVLGDPRPHVQRVASMRKRPRLRTMLPMWIQAGRITLCVSTQLQQRSIVPG